MAYPNFWAPACRFSCMPYRRALNINSRSMPNPFDF
jgi:hypothetical protein